MKQVNDMDTEIKIHILGLQRLIAMGQLDLSGKKTFDLSDAIIGLCKNSGLSYSEIQKAIVYADNSLYSKLKPNKSV